MVARHAIKRKAGKRHEIGDVVIQLRQGIEDAGPLERLAADLLGQRIQCPPVIQRQALAQLEAGARQMQHMRGQPTLVLGIEDGAQQGAHRTALFASLGQHADGFAQCGQRPPFAGVVDVVAQAAQRHAQVTCEIVAALGIAPEPEQVLYHPARQAGATAHQIGRRHRAPQQRDRRPGGLATDPYILAATATLIRQNPGVVLAGRARQPAGHHHIALGRGYREHPQTHRTGQQLAAMATIELRRTRERHQLLCIVVARIGPYPRLQLRQPILIQILAKDGLDTPPLGMRHGTLENEMSGFFQRIFHDRSLAAPPGGHPGQREGFAQQVLAQAGQEARQRPGFDHAGANAVGQQYIAASHHVHQTGHAQRRVGTQFERIAEIIIHAAHDGMHPAQAGEGLEPHAAVSHRKILPLDQREAQVARQIGVLEIGFVVRPWRQQYGIDPAIILRRIGGDGIAQGGIKIRQSGHAQLAEKIRKQAGADDAVFKCIAHAGGRLAAVIDDPPLPVWRARQVHREDMQEAPAGRRDAMRGALETRMAQHQRRRQTPLVEEGLRAVEISQHAVEQLGALRHPALYAGPLGRRDDQRQRIHRPGATRSILVAIHVVGHTVVTDLAINIGEQLAQLRRGLPDQALEKRVVMRTRHAGGFEHFIEAAGVVRVFGEELSGHEDSCDYAGCLARNCTPGRPSKCASLV